MTRATRHLLGTFQRVLIALGMFALGFTAKACLPAPPVKAASLNLTTTFTAVGQRVPVRIITVESGSYRLTVRSDDTLIYRKDVDFLDWRSK